MSAAAAEAVGGMLSENTTLKTLDVSGNSFGKLAVGDRVKLKSSGEMKIVIDSGWSDGSIKIEGDKKIKPSEFEWESHFPTLCAGLGRNLALESLDASKNGLGSAGGEALAEALKTNMSLQGLNANSNAMGTAAAEAFGGMLPLNKTLQTLDVSNNSFGRKPAVGNQVKLKSSGEMCTASHVFDNEIYTVEKGGNTSFKHSTYEWKSQVPAFCAGVAASQSLTSVSNFFRLA
jgi:Ran GTPase-activating protein (RanGAP) involved in mRNA processing and transport